MGSQTGLLPLEKSPSQVTLPAVLCEHLVCARHHAKRFIEVVHPILVTLLQGKVSSPFNG